MLLALSIEWQCWLLQVLAAQTLGSLGRSGRSAKARIRDAGALTKLKQLSAAASLAPASVKDAAHRALFDISESLFLISSSSCLIQHFLPCIVTKKRKEKKENASSRNSNTIFHERCCHAVHLLPI
jgi:hypothetical protein